MICHALSSFCLALISRQIYRAPMRRACLKIQSGPAAVDFGGGQGGEAGASPQSSALAEPTPANAKRRAAGPLLISRPAHHAANRVPAETDCPGCDLGIMGGEALPAAKSRKLIGFLHCRYQFKN